MVAAASEKVEVGELLIKHFPWCVPWQNKAGLDAVSLIFMSSLPHAPSVHLLQPPKLPHSTISLAPSLPRQLLPTKPY